eukprot:3314087-Rhodomonas_salina.2
MVCLDIRINRTRTTPTTYWQTSRFDKHGAGSPRPLSNADLSRAIDPGKKRGMGERAYKTATTGSVPGGTMSSRTSVVGLCDSTGSPAASRPSLTWPMMRVVCQ